MSAFKAGTERFVLFSDAMTEGFDLGPVELVCELDTNGASRSQMLQRLGRATRNPAKGTQAHADFVSFVSCDSAQQVRQRARRVPRRRRGVPRERARPAAQLAPTARGSRAVPA